ncbi:hypothetical protein [Microbulbifer agarilyticus]
MTQENLKTTFLLITLVLLCSTAVQARAAYSNWAIPEQIEYVNDGILVSGNFGNPSNCSNENFLFISRTAAGDEPFKVMTSMVLSALTSKREIRMHTTQCFNVSYHGKNVSESTTAVFIR